MMNLPQICTAIISGFLMKQRLMRRTEILIYLRLPSAFLSVNPVQYRVAACIQMSLSAPLPKGRGRGIQIHAPRPVGLGLNAEQYADLFPRDKMNIGRLGVGVAAPVRYRCKYGSVSRYAKHGADNGVMLLSIQLQRLVYLFDGQILHAEDHRLQRMVARVYGDGGYIVHASHERLGRRRSPVLPVSFHCFASKTKRYCGAITYRGGERAGLF